LLIETAKDGEKIATSLARLNGDGTANHERSRDMAGPLSRTSHESDRAEPSPRALRTSLPIIERDSLSTATKAPE